MSGTGSEVGVAKGAAGGLPSLSQALQLAERQRWCASSTGVAKTAMQLTSLRVSGVEVGLTQGRASAFQSACKSSLFSMLA